MKKLRISKVTIGMCLFAAAVFGTLLLVKTLEAQKKEITRGGVQTTEELIAKFGRPTEITESNDNSVLIENWRYSRIIPVFGYDVAYSVSDGKVVAFIARNP